MQESIEGSRKAPGEETEHDVRVGGVHPPPRPVWLWVVIVLTVLLIVVGFFFTCVHASGSDWRKFEKTFGLHGAANKGYSKDVCTAVVKKLVELRAEAELFGTRYLKLKEETAKLPRTAPEEIMYLAEQARVVEKMKQNYLQARQRFLNAGRWASRFDYGVEAEACGWEKHYQDEILGEYLWADDD